MEILVSDIQTAPPPTIRQIGCSVLYFENCNSTHCQFSLSLMSDTMKLFMRGYNMQGHMI